MLSAMLRLHSGTGCIDVISIAVRRLRPFYWGDKSVRDTVISTVRNRANGAISGLCEYISILKRQADCWPLAQICSPFFLTVRLVAPRRSEHAAGALQ